MGQHDEHTLLRRIEAFLILAGRTQTSTGFLRDNSLGITVETMTSEHYLVADPDGWMYYEDNPSGGEWIEHGIIAGHDTVEQDVAAAFDEAIRYGMDPAGPAGPTSLKRLHETITDAIERAAIENLPDLDGVGTDEWRAMADVVVHHLTRHTHLPPGCDTQNMPRIAASNEPAMSTMLRKLAAALDEHGYDPELVDHRGAHAAEITLAGGHVIGLAEHTDATYECARWSLYLNGDPVKWQSGTCTPCAMVAGLIALNWA